MRRALRNDEGFSLIELLVAMSVGTVVILAAFTVLDISLSTQSSATDRIETVQRGRQTMNEISRVLRSHTCLSNGHPGIVEATPTSVRLHSAVGGERLNPGFQKIDDRRIVYDATTRKLTLETYAGIEAATPSPDTTTFSTTATTRVIGEQIRQDGTTPIFRYYTFQGDPAAATLEVNPGTGIYQAAKPAAANAQLMSIARIEVRYLVRVRDSGSSGAKYSLFTNSFWIRSADPAVSSAGGGCT